MSKIEGHKHDIPEHEYTPVKKGEGLMNEIDRSNKELPTYEDHGGYAKGSKGVESLGIPKGEKTSAKGSRRERD